MYVRLFLCTILVAWNTGTFAQDHCWIKYNYDAAGNRIKRYWWCGDPNEIDPGEKSALKQDFGLRLFPNPAAETVRLASTQEFTNAELNVLDMQGRRVHQQRFTGSSLDLDVSMWSAGRYTLFIRTEMEEYTTGFSVMH
jgi:hypothetical protein